MQTPSSYDCTPRFVHFGYKFTGKERDSESGLDYFGARYYGSNMGRWMSPDWSENPEAVPYSNLENPQSLNLYNYVNNNPLSKSDPNGHCDVDGEHHGALWCFGHALGFTETAKEQHADADNIRNLIAGKHLVAANGLPITAAVLAGMSDKDVTSLAQQGMGQQLDQMSDIGQLIDAAIGAGTGTKHDTSGTGASAKATDIKTNISADEFGKNLEASGYTKSVSKDGNAINYTNGDKTYSVYKGNNGSSAQLKIGSSNQPVAKIRFDR